MALSRLVLASQCITQFTPPLQGDPLAGLKKTLFIGMGFAANDKNNPHRTPGKSNKEIADNIIRIEQEARERGIEVRVLVQREVAEALCRNYPDFPVAKVLQERPGEFHISSVDILEQAYEYACEQGIFDALLFAHYRHALRALWSAQCWGFNVRLAPCYARSYTWGDRPSQTQWHTWCAPIFIFVWDLPARAKLIAIDIDEIEERKRRFQR